MTMNRKGIVILSVLLACTVLASFSIIKRYQARDLERSIDELPIIIVHKSDGSMHFTCLNREKCIPPIESFGWLSNCGIDEESMIYCLFDLGDIVYVDLERQSASHIAIDSAPRFEGALHFLYAYGKIVLADFETVIIISKDSSYKVVQPEVADEIRGILIGGLVRGREDQVIAFSPSLVEEDGEDFAKIFIIDLNSGDVTEKLLPCPLSMEITQASCAERGAEVRYGLRIVGVTADLEKVYYIYYSFPGSNEMGGGIHTQLGMFDTRSGQETRVYRGPGGCVPPPGRYRQHNGYLFVEPGKGGPLLLRLEDLSPVVDFEALQERGLGFGIQALSPFGRYFLVGTPTEAFVLSQDGDILREYSLPVELFGKSYTFVEYSNE